MATRIVSAMRAVGVVITGCPHHGCGLRVQPIAGRALGVGERLGPYWRQMKRFSWLEC
jgi:hypothetical protein